MRKKLLTIALTLIGIACIFSSCKTTYSGNELKNLSMEEIVRQNPELILPKSVTEGKLADTSKNKDLNKVPTTREELDDMKMVTKIYNGKTDAGMTIPGFGGIKLGKEESNLNLYYLETKKVDTITYGIGYSMHYHFKKTKKGIDLSKLSQVAASVALDKGKTEAFFSIQSYGIRSLNLVNYWKPQVNRSFDVEGFSIVQSSIDGIQNILGDTLLSKSVKFTPQVLDFIKAKD